MIRMYRSAIRAAAPLALAALLALAPAALAAPQPAALLTGSPAFVAASGKAKLDVNLGLAQIVVEVEAVPQLAGAPLDLFIGGTLASTTTLDALGNGRFVVDIGAGNLVTEIPAGTSVEVKTETADGTAGLVVVSGTSL